MKFIETLCWCDILLNVISKKTIFFQSKSLGARATERVMLAVGLRFKTHKLDFGDINNADGIRARAYLAAEDALQKIPGKAWADNLSNAFDLDVWLCFRKFIFDQYYLKFQFLEFALRYAEENSEITFYLRADQDNLEAYLPGLREKFELSFSRTWNSLRFFTILLLPLFVEFFAFKKLSKRTIKYQNSVVCEVDGKKTYNMFRDLFSSIPPDKLFFVCEPRNSSAFVGAEVKPLLLQRDSLVYLRSAVWMFMGKTLLSFHKLHQFGGLLFRFFYLLMQGRAETISGKGNLYCTFEHLITYKAIRNSYLSRSGNTSVFVPLNSYVTSQYFHSEIFLNYYVVCAGGPHIELTYRKKNALTNIFLPTGSYESHKLDFRIDERAERRNMLRTKIQSKTIVLIVSPGICDPTYKHELQLMELARNLSKLPDLKIIVRLKPVEPEEKYKNFYHEQLNGAPDILVTAGEYELFDFLGLADLVVTTISSGAFDLAQAGADVMFIDFLGDRQLSIPWLEVPEILVAPDKCWDVLCAWIEDKDDMRSHWHVISSRLTKAVAFQKPSFHEYKEGFISQILPWVPLDIDNKDSSNTL